MARSGVFLLVTALLASASPGVGAEEISLSGSWKVLLPLQQTGEQPFAVLRLEQKEGSITGKILATTRGYTPWTLKQVRLDRDTLRLEVVQGDTPLRLEFLGAESSASRLRGTFRTRGNVQPAELQRTTVTSLDQYELSKELVAQKTEGVVVTATALSLLSQATQRKATTEEVRSWAAKASHAAQAYGTDWSREVLLAICEILNEQKGFEAVSLPYARQAERLLTPRDRPLLRKRTLDALLAALRHSNKEEEAKGIEKRLAALDFTIKPIAFPGRKSESTHAVLVELFTASHHPSCVADEVALEALARTFKASEVVLLQYHLATREPDPLANEVGLRRVEYYRERLKDIPTAFFDGQTAVSEGGGFEEGPEVYESFVSAIRKRLEPESKLQLEASGRRQGNRITVEVQATGIPAGRKKLRLRVALVEEQVKYTGKSKLPTHHHVVRAFLGIADGFELTKESSFKKSLTVDVAEIRSHLKSYLEEVGREIPFPDKERPLDLGGLRVVAFVQDDASMEVLQSAQTEQLGNK